MASTFSITRHGFHSTSSSASTPTSHPTLSTLAYEICHMILASPILDNQDRKAARLSCRHLEGICTDLIFQKIALSTLTLDRDAFINITKQPRLAQHVRQLIWYEVPRNDQFRLFRQIRGLDESNPDIVDDDIEGIIPILHALISDCFWLPAEPTVSDTVKLEETKVVRRDAISQFSPFFSDALVSMPNLRCFIGEPIPPHRKVTKNGYAITADILYSQSTCNSDDDVMSNDGLFNFLLPAMANSSLKVEVFRWVDQYALQTIDNIRETPPITCNLTSIDLCLTWAGPRLWDRIGDLQMARCRKWLHSAIALRDLKLSHEYDLSGGLSKYDAINPLSLFYGFDPISLHDMIAFLFEENPADAFYSWLRSKSQGRYTPWPQLLSLTLEGFQIHNYLDLFMKQHSSTIRHLHLEHCEVTVSMINRWSKISGLKLDCIDLKDAHPRLDLSVETMLEYINDKVMDSNLLAPIEDFLDLCVISTQQSGHGCNLGVIFDLSEEPDEDSYPADDILGDTVVNLGDHDANWGSGPFWMYGVFTVQNKHDPEGEMFMWQVPHGTPHALPTEIWKFTNRDGEVAYGWEPLEWFEDWDLAFGDRAEPTPYGPWSDPILHRINLVAPLPEQDIPDGAVQWSWEERHAVRNALRDCTPSWWWFY